MSKRYCMFISALFCGFLLFFLAASAIAPDKTFSQVENRELAQMPAFSMKTVSTGEFMSKFETYMTDQFVFRDQWVAFKSIIERVLGKQENNGVYFCGQDTLITRFDEPDGEKVSSNLNYVNKFVENVDIPVYLSLIPTQACIWADRLPEGAPNASQTAVLEQAKAATAARWFDTYAPLWDHRAEDIFYRTDHHWTSLGAYYGYAAFMEAIGETPLPLGEKITVSEDFYGTLYSSSGVHWVPPDTIERYVREDAVTVEDVYGGGKHGLYVDSFLEEKDQYASFLGGNQPLYIVRNSAASSDKKLLLVRDSYSDSLAPFLCRHFAEIHLLDLRYNKTSVAQYAADMGADGIAVLYSVDNFMKDADAVFLAQ